MAVVLPSLRAIVVPAPPPDMSAILDNVFVTRRLSLPDGDVLILPHGRDSLTMLSNMGVNVDGCELFDWYYTPPSLGGNHPWWWQLNTARFLSSNKRAFCTSTPRTGKTLSTMMAADFVQQQRGGAVLIIAPLTVANGGEWEKTCREWFPKKKVVLIHKDRQREAREPADVYLINPAGVKIVPDILASRAERGGFCVCVIDELTEYANPRSQQWQAVNKVVKNIPYCWGLTGTPGAPDKIYGQVKLINPTNVPRSFKRWREMTELQVSTFKWVPKHGHEAIVKDAMSPCIRYDKEQLMRIPSPIVEAVHVPLSPEQDRATVQLAEQLRTVIADKEITASSVAIKLLQVAGGVVRAGEDDTATLDCQPKLDKLMELIRSTPRKKVVFGSFTAVNDMLVEYIRAQGFTCEKIDGGVTGQSRAKTLKDFLDGNDPHVLVCHPRTTAYGVELASADAIICYGPPVSGAFIYQQMAERLSSVRQTADKTYIYHLAAVMQDIHAFAALSRGVNISRNIVNLFSEVIDELAHTKNAL